jgi:hypothetical protein
MPVTDYPEPCHAGHQKIEMASIAGVNYKTSRSPRSILITSDDGANQENVASNEEQLIISRSLA